MPIIVEEVVARDLGANVGDMILKGPLSLGKDNNHGHQNTGTQG